MKVIELINSHKVALVDDDDYDLVSQYKWYEDPGRNVSYAASREVIKGKQVRMHRLILGLGADSPEHVDHKNSDGLDCQRDNMRVCTHQQNMANTRHLPGASGYRGVSPRKGRFTAKITVRYTQIYLGIFDSAEEAARAYDVAARNHFGQFARLNFDVEEVRV